MWEQHQWCQTKLHCGLTKFRLLIIFISADKSISQLSSFNQPINSYCLTFINRQVWWVHCNDKWQQEEGHTIYVYPHIIKGNQEVLVCDYIHTCTRTHRYYIILHTSSEVSVYLQVLGYPRVFLLPTPTPVHYQCTSHTYSTYSSSWHLCYTLHKLFLEEK